MRMMFYNYLMRMMFYKYLMRAILCPYHSTTVSNCQSIQTESNLGTSRPRVEGLSSNVYISLEYFSSFQVFTWRMIYFSMVVDYNDECTLNIFFFNGHDYMIRLFFQSSISIMNQRQWSS